MRRGKIFSNATLALGAILGIASFSPAMAATDRAFTFKDVEYRYSAEERVAAAKSAFESLIPLGAPLDQAVATLRRAGAYCGGAQAGRTEINCTYSAFEAVEDFTHDVVWRVRLRANDGRVTGMSVDRATAGA